MYRLNDAETGNVYKCGLTQAWMFFDDCVGLGCLSGPRIRTVDVQ